MLAERRDRRCKRPVKVSSLGGRLASWLLRMKEPRKTIESRRVSGSEPMPPVSGVATKFLMMAVYSGETCIFGSDMGTSKRAEAAAIAERRWREPVYERGTSEAVDGRSGALSSPWDSGFVTT